MGKKKEEIQPEVLVEDEIVTGEEGLHELFKFRSKVTIKKEKLAIDDIVTSNFKKVSRSDTLIGLSGVVREWGVVNPIHVLKLEDADSYLLLDGLRRVFAAVRSNVTEIEAMVWDFEDKEEGKEKANLVTLLVNRSERYSAQEQWEQMKILEDVNDITPALMEFLLQMNPGEAMKLKDVMLSESKYEDIRTELLVGKYTIEAAYRKLNNERKKDNKLEREDVTGLQGAVAVDDPAKARLSVDEVKDLLDLTTTSVAGRRTPSHSFDGPLEDSSLDEMYTATPKEETLESLDRSQEARGGIQVQEKGKRKPLDTDLKKAVMARDNFTCQCCGLGGEQRLATLAAHHKVEVSQGGPDTLDNLVTVCVNCHLLIHNYAWGKIFIDIKALDPNEQETFKNIFTFGNIIIEANKRLGRTKENAAKDVQASLRHPYPTELLADNKEAFAEAEKPKDV